MNSICITGYLPVDLSLVESILNQAGMKPALSSQRDRSMTISLWHEQVEMLLSKNIDYENKKEIGAVSHLGRLWEQLASDIFISNLQSTTWGWSDIRSANLLPFWKDFDPQLRFILVVCSPERLIANVIEESDDTPNVELILNQLKSHYLALHAFYKANSKRSILVNIQDCLDQPAVFLQMLNKNWGLQLNKVHFPNIKDIEFSDLSRYLASRLVQVSSFYQDLSETVYESLAINPSGLIHNSVPSHAALISWYRKMREDLLQKGHDHRELLDKQNKLIDQVSQDKEKISKLSAQNFLLESKLKEQATELDKLIAENSKLQKNSKAHDVVIKDLNESLSQCAAFESKLAEAKIAIETALNERDKQITIASDLNSKLIANKIQIESLNLKEKELNEESEFLLLQLQQVQEELENYFHKYQEASKAVVDSHARWRRMLVRNPNYCDIESLEMEPIVGDKKHRTNWKIKGMDAVGRHISDLSFVTFIEKGIAGLEFSRTDNDSAGLLRWPTALYEDNNLTIAMNGDNKTSEKSALAIIGLATSDWSLLGILINLLRSELLSPTLLKIPKTIDPTILIKALDKLQENLKAIPEVLRYDKVKLKREQVNPDYEHLWFSFENMKSQEQLIGDFDYRISCASIRPHKFGGHPKLEFPEETCKKAILSWYDESYDDYGSKLELRFALPDSMDMEVWEKISAHDQNFIHDLIRQLPEVMDDLRLNGIIPKRGWDEWLAMTRETERILAMREEQPNTQSSPRRSSSRKTAL